MTPCFSSRSMRLCTLVRERPTSRASCGGRGPRILPQGGNQLLVDGVHAFRPFRPTNRLNYTLKTLNCTLPFAGSASDNGRAPSFLGEVVMKNIVIVGAGKIGSMIAELLGRIRRLRRDGHRPLAAAARSARDARDRHQSGRRHQRKATRCADSRGQVRGPERGPLSRDPADRRSGQGRRRPLPGS